jgi:hypothetical protein
MNLPKIRTTMSSALSPSDPPYTFIIVIFAIAIGVGAAITYFGITGALGGPIP